MNELIENSKTSKQKQQTRQARSKRGKNSLRQHAAQPLTQRACRQHACSAFSLSGNAPDWLFGPESTRKGSCTDRTATQLLPAECAMSTMLPSTARRITSSSRADQPQPNRNSHQKRKKTKTQRKSNLGFFLLFELVASFYLLSGRLIDTRCIWLSVHR